VATSNNTALLSSSPARLLRCLQDEHVLAFNKPVGMACQVRGEGQRRGVRGGVPERASEPRSHTQSASSTVLEMRLQAVG